MGTPREEGQSIEWRHGARDEGPVDGLERKATIEKEERLFFSDVDGVANAVVDKVANQLFGEARDFVHGLDQPAVLRPFLEKAASSSDIKTAGAAKVALARLDIGNL